MLAHSIISTTAPIANKTRFEKTALMIISIGFFLVILSLGAFALTHLQQPNLKNAYLYPKLARTLPEFTLTDFNQSTFQKSHLYGKWSFIFFGYTHCPDICPQTLQTMQLVAKGVDRLTLEDAVQFIFISIDPERDQYEQLKNYVQYFNPTFLGLSGNQTQLQKANEIFGTSYNKIEDNNNVDYYYMGHSAAIYITNPKAERFALLPPPLQANDIISDFGSMLTL